MSIALTSAVYAIKESCYRCQAKSSVEYSEITHLLIRLPMISATGASGYGFCICAT